MAAGTAPAAPSEADRVAVVVQHARTLIGRLEALPPIADRQLQAARRERVRALRWAVAAGQQHLSARRVF